MLRLKYEVVCSTFKDCIDSGGLTGCVHRFCTRPFGIQLDWEPRFARSLGATTLSFLPSIFAESSTSLAPSTVPKKKQANARRVLLQLYLAMGKAKL